MGWVGSLLPFAIGNYGMINEINSKTKKSVPNVFNSIIFRSLVRHSLNTPLTTSNRWQHTLVSSDQFIKIQ